MSIKEVLVPDIGEQQPEAAHHVLPLEVAVPEHREAKPHGDRHPYADKHADRHADPDTDDAAHGDADLDTDAHADDRPCDAELSADQHLYAELHRLPRWVQPHGQA